MGQYSEKEWYKRELNKYLKEYGEVPPPWIFDLHIHPYSIGWRMGGGETFMMVFCEWFPVVRKTERERLDYFKKYNPPPRWLGFVARSVWDIQNWTEPGFSYDPYFQKLKEAGFVEVDDYQKDLDEDKSTDI